MASEPLEFGPHLSIRQILARDRDGLMFRRGAVLTFGNDKHPLYLMSYHRPFLPIVSPNQDRVSYPPISAAEFLSGIHGKISLTPDGMR